MHLKNEIFMKRLIIKSNKLVYSVSSEIYNKIFMNESLLLCILYTPTLSVHNFPLNSIILKNTFISQELYANKHFMNHVCLCKINYIKSIRKEFIRVGYCFIL